jgi:hypothetical protein
MHPLNAKPSQTVAQQEDGISISQLVKHTCTCCVGQRFGCPASCRMACIPSLVTCPLSGRVRAARLAKKEASLSPRAKRSWSAAVATCAAVLLLVSSSSALSPSPCAPAQGLNLKKMFRLKRMKVEKNLNTANPGAPETFCRLWFYDGSFPFTPGPLIRNYRHRLIAVVEFSYTAPDLSNPASRIYLESFPEVLATDTVKLTVPHDPSELQYTNIPISAEGLGAEHVLAVKESRDPSFAVNGAWWSSKSGSILDLSLGEGAPGSAAVAHFATIAAKIVPAYFQSGRLEHP